MDGWKREDIEPYLKSGLLIDTGDKFNDPPELAYFILDVGAKLDIPRLYKEKVSTVMRAFDHIPNESDLEFMERKNW